MLLDRHQIRKTDAPCTHTRTHSYTLVRDFETYPYVCANVLASKHETNTINKVDREYSEDSEV